MRPVARILAFGALASSTALFAGCVPQDRYDQLLMTNRSLNEQLVAKEDRLAEADTSLRVAQDQLAQTRAAYGDLKTSNDAMSETVTGMEAANARLFDKVSGWEVGPLPADIESQIQNLAAAHPDLLTFDAAAGMMRLSSDFTFDLGSTELKANAKTTLGQLARILNDPTVSDLEVRVVGHTDNVKIGKPETRRQHPTNMHLSVHRAIAVRDVLLANGFPAVRTQVAGYGEMRPIVANGIRGAASNRRVEIYFGAMPATGLEGLRTDAEATAAPTPDVIEPMK